MFWFNPLLQWYDIAMEKKLLRVGLPATGEKTGPLCRLLQELPVPFAAGGRVGIKLHWGEKGNSSFLPPHMVREIVRWLEGLGARPFVFDTTVLYSGGRRTGRDSLATAAEHGYHEEFLGCPVVIADGMDGRNVIDIPAGYKHFEFVEVASLVNDTEGFVVFSHFKGHAAAGFGGALKNIAMGFASRAQKQRMHADVYPELDADKCSRCGDCVALCPSGAARLAGGGYPAYDHELCIGCAQCIAHCPEMALQILWGEDIRAFQERLVETAAALWQVIGSRTICINALVGITAECDCLAGDNPLIAPDFGFVGGHHPVNVDRESLEIIGCLPIEQAHPGIPWRRQFTYAEEIGF